MTSPPSRPKLYYITRVDNLPSIVADELVSDAAMIARGGPAQAIGMSGMKRQRFERVAQLVEGFESPFGLELLSTVHWVATRDRPASKDDLITRFYGWADRKRQFTPQQIRLARRDLAEKGWIRDATG